MEGVILLQRGKTKFRHNETKFHYLVTGAYDSSGKLRDVFKFQNGQEVEAEQVDEATVNIKFNPMDK